MAHHEKGQADCLSFFVARYPGEVVTRQLVAVDRQFAARQILAEGFPLAGNGNIPKTRNIKAWQIACPFSWRVIRAKSLRGNLLPSIVNFQFVFMIHYMIDFAIILCKMQTKNH